MKKEIISCGYSLIKEGTDEKWVKKEENLDEGKSVSSDLKKIKHIFKWNSENPEHWLNKQKEDVKDSFWRIYNASGLGD